MNDWSDGYVTDLAYTSGFYKELVPSFLGFVGLVASTDVPMWGTKTIRYLELGCGQGVTASIIAAANPEIEVVALDYNPAHIAEAQSLAKCAGISNVEFLEMSFDEAKNSPNLGSFDVISLHGIYSWVAPEVRAQIVQLIRQNLRTGGLVYISYNSYPGRAPLVPVQRLLEEVANAEPSLSMIDRLNRGLNLLERLQKTGAAYFTQNPSVGRDLDRLKENSPHYLVHEFLGASWSPFFFSDVAQDMSSAKVDFIGSADLLMYFDALNLTAEQQTVLNEISNKVQRQLIRDFFLNRSFRRDVFARGARRIFPAEIESRWRVSRFALAKSRRDISLKMKGRLGEISLQPDYYEPVIAALEKAPQTVSELLSDKHIASLGMSRLQQVLTLLVAQDVCQPALSQSGEVERRKCTDRLNQALLERAVTNADIAYLASPVLGGGVPVDPVTQLAFLSSRNKADDVPEFIWNTLMRQGRGVKKDGKPSKSRDEALEVIRRLVDASTGKFQLLSKLGVF